MISALILIPIFLFGGTFILFLLISLGSARASLSDMRRKYSDVLNTALGWENAARKYYTLYLKEQKNIKQISSDPNMQVSWRVVFGFAKNDNLTKADVNSRYKKLAMVYHPDQSGGSTYGMKLLNLAKEKADLEFK